jgi:hypothetical protein
MAYEPQISEHNHSSIARASNRALLTEPQTEKLGGLQLVYRGAGTVIIAGPRFRRVYVFSSKEPEQSVETQDVDALVTTGLFLIRR